MTLQLRNPFDEPLVNVRKKQTHFPIGFTGAGKSATDEKIARKLIAAGQTCFDGYGGDLYESLFWSTTLGCCYDEKYPCNCHGFDEDTSRLPMTVFAPEDWTLLDDRGNTENDVGFSNPLKNYNLNKFSKYEWRQYERQKAKLNGIDPNSLTIDYDRMNPPEKPQGKPRTDWIKIVKLPNPQMTGKGIGIFDKPNNCVIRDIFIDEMDNARYDRRVVVFSPGLFPKEFYRYQTLNIMVRSVRELKFQRFVPPTVASIGKPESQWTLQDHNKDKLFLLLREVGQLLNNELKSDESGYSTLAKKAILYYIRLGRQWGCGCIMDAQNMMEVLKNVRVLVDVIWIKYGPKWLFGDSLDFVFDYITEQRKIILDDLGHNEYGYEIANQEWPEIQTLLPNQAYALRKESNIPLLVTTPLPEHHHWDPEHGDEFRNITGIYWGYKNQEEKVVVTSQPESKVLDYGNSYEMITAIKNAPKEQRKEWAKKYDYKMPKKPTWIDHYFIYTKLVEDKKITTNKIIPTWIAMKVWYNRQVKSKE